jgi:glycosyltransferase involved in cell wall biosynthesis
VNIVRGADLHLKPSWDIIFTLNDPFIFEQPIVNNNIGLMDALNDLSRVFREKLPPEHWHKIVSYWPVDAPIKENWVEHAIGLSDYSVAYTKYGKKEIERANQKSGRPIEKNFDVIYHGTNTESFYPIPKEQKLEFKKMFFRKANIDIDTTFIVGVVARNQVRKDLPRVMKIFKEFQRRRPDSMLYLHSNPIDVGGSLGEYARNFNLELGKDWIFPGNFNENTGYPVETLNKIYNIMDVQLSATTGEGWGLPITEAMAAKVLNIAPNITSIPELFNTEGNNYDDVNQLENAEIRGIPVKAGSTSSEWETIGPMDYERVRPLTNVDDAVKKLIWVYDNPEKAKVIADRAFNWIQQYSWKTIAKQWDEYLQRVYNDLEEERKNAVQTDTGETDRPEQLKSERNESDTDPKA